jgi:anti-sigma B factor antagonist
MDAKTNQKSHTTVKIAGNLDGQKSDELMISIEKLIVPGNVDILVNFENVEYISSMGIGTLISLYRDIKEKNGRFIIYGVRDVVKDIFDRTHLNKRLLICETEKDALDLLHNKD